MSLSKSKRDLARYGWAPLLDLLSVVLAFYAALVLRFSGQAPARYYLQFRQYVLAIALLYCLSNWFLGLYHHLWRYASSQEILSVIQSVTTSTLVAAVIDLLWRPQRPLPLSVMFAGGAFTFGAFALVRYYPHLVKAFLWRWRSRTATTHLEASTRVLLVGAGKAGQLLAWRLQNHTEAGTYQIVGFADDDPHKQGMMVHGLRVLGARQAIPEIVRKAAIDLIVIAIHNISGQDFRDILAICQSTAARIKTLPNVLGSLESSCADALLREVTPEDLLGRQPVAIDRSACRDLLEDKVVLVTGAGGSIGSELCRRILEHQPRLLVMIDNNETSLFDLDMELRSTIGDLADCSGATPSGLRCVVGDVTSRHSMRSVFARFRPQIVLHAAAYKHVPLMEEHPQEAIRVNLGGTLITYELAAAHGAERFVFVSTDKAVDPCNIMGCTKRLGELLVTTAASGTDTVACAVRFGNVLGSRGSVVPVFWKQIDMGGPVTVTHPEACRYFMTIGEAASLILQSASLARGGEIFVLDMGEPIHILELAQRMIRLRGLRIGDDIPIVYTGLRAGERLSEQLVASAEELRPTSHPKVFCIRDSSHVTKGPLLAEISHLLQSVEVGASPAQLRNSLLALAGASRVATPERHDGRGEPVGLTRTAMG